MAEHNRTGKRGEEVAARFLQGKGYAIAERNFRTKRAEIDIVARNKNILVLVEVRTRTLDVFGSPEETINAQKKRKLLGNGFAYVSRIRHRGPWRIDAVCVVFGGETGEEIERIAHYENIV